MNVSTDTHPGRGASVEVMVDLALAKLPTDLSGPEGGAKSIIFTTRAIGVPGEVVNPRFVVPTSHDKVVFTRRLGEQMRQRGARIACFLHHQKNSPDVWGLVVIWANEENPLVRCIHNGLAKLAVQQVLAAQSGVTN